MTKNNDNLNEEGYKRAVEILRKAATPHGFVASTTTVDNYRRIWARDGVICSLAAMLLGDEELNHTALQTLRTLMQNQGPHGEIPSNVDPERGTVSFGGTAGRVDANLWWIIGVWKYWQLTKDERFLDEFLPVVRRVEHLLGAWEFNGKGLVYVPETGDWADEYLQHGYVLYDQILYWYALQGAHDMYCSLNDNIHHVLREHTQKVHDNITANYWFHNVEGENIDKYHDVIYEKGKNAAKDRGPYWMPFFSPTGYGFRFDAMANSLISLVGIATPEQSDLTDKYIAENVIRDDMKVLPAFSPVIDENDSDWESLQIAYSNAFKNKPYKFHNGGLWPLINGFYIASLAKRGKTDLAREYLHDTHRANKMSDKPDGEWDFYEFIDGQTLEPGGTIHQTWSATAAIIGHHAIENNKYPL